jgi:hypothetical protein
MNVLVKNMHRNDGYFGNPEFKVGDILEVTGDLWKVDNPIGQIVVVVDPVLYKYEHPDIHVDWSHNVPVKFRTGKIDGYYNHRFKKIGHITDIVNKYEQLENLF